MKIIITEKQYKILESQQDDERAIRNALYAIWQNELDSTGEIDFQPNIGKYVGYKKTTHIYEIYRDFLGGWDKMVAKASELMDRTFDTNDYYFSGGYDFRFKVNVFFFVESEKNNTLFVVCPIESDGKVTLMIDGKTHLLSKLEENWVWDQVEDEIMGLIDDILYEEVTKKTGIMINVNKCPIEE